MNILEGNREAYESNGAITMMMLETGATVIAAVYDGWGNYSPAKGFCLLHHPARVITERPHGGILAFMLEPWMPDELLVSATISIRWTSIMGLMSPSPELVGFYKAWATIEADKLKTMGKLYSAQVAKLETTFTEQYADAKKRWVVGNAGMTDQNNEALLAFFEEDLTWGNTKITH